jgi:hypothetical protein
MLCSKFLTSRISTGRTLHCLHSELISSKRGARRRGALSRGVSKLSKTLIKRTHWAYPANAATPALRGAHPLKALIRPIVTARLTSWLLSPLFSQDAQIFIFPAPISYLWDRVLDSLCFSGKAEVLTFLGANGCAIWVPTYIDPIWEGKVRARTRKI